MWHAITGHGVDHDKIPKFSFELLSLIAAHGPRGILQPMLTQLSRQDKRSVPKRTDMLTERGYITKQSVVSHELKCTTALCTLSKFGKKSKEASRGVTDDGIVGDGVMYYGALLDRILKAFEGRELLTLSDLKKEMVRKTS